jgi:hypothetical protein
MRGRYLRIDLDQVVGFCNGSDTFWDCITVGISVTDEELSNAQKGPCIILILILDNILVFSSPYYSNVLFLACIF